MTYVPLEFLYLYIFLSFTLTTRIPLLVHFTSGVEDTYRMYTAVDKDGKEKWVTGHLVVVYSPRNLEVSQELITNTTRHKILGLVYRHLF